MGVARRKLTIIAAILALVVVAGGGGAAFAYWTAQGSGTGSATSGTSASFTVTSSAPTGAALSPGGTAQTVAFSVANPGSGSQNLFSFTVTVASAGGTAWTAVAGRSAADYSVGVPTITYGEIAGSASVSGTVTITMIDRAVSQDGCKGAAVPLYFSAS